MAYGTLRADLIENTNGLTGNAIGPGFKNRIINGDMRIDQRNSGASVTPSNLAYTLDRWQCFLSGGGAYSVQQSSTAPAGFVNSLLVTTTTADSSIAAGDYYILTQIIEGTNISDLAWGSASAKTVTLSFWVRSSLTGTFSGALNNSAGNRSYPFSYTISAADTWEQKSVTITGDTTGTWLTTTGKGIVLRLSLGMGSTYSGTASAWAAADYYATTSETAKVIGTLNATFYITGVQLEVGPSATSFDYRPYGTELALCQRYCSVWRATTATQSYSNAAAIGATDIRAAVQYPVEMRAAPTITYSGTFDVRSATLDSKTFTFNAASNIGVMSYSASGSAVNNATAGESLVIRAVNASTSYVTYSAEL